MANLRSLLSTIVPGIPVSDFNLPQGCQFIFQSTCHQCYFEGYQENCCVAWIVPAGVTCATFEIWGGGGGGAGSCCCMGGPPGGSGAYAKKTIPVTAATCYQLFLGPATACSATNTGCLGYPSYVIGTGLTNFCAEGGIGGCSYCNPQCCNAMCTCGCNPVTATLLTSSISGTTLTIGSVSAGTVKAGMKLSGTNVTTDTTIVSGSGLTWNLDRSSTAASTTITATNFLQAQAYGGDVNRDGVRGCYQMWCCNHPCDSKSYIPYPAGLVNQCGGVAVVGHWSTGYNDNATCIGTSYIGWGMHKSQYIPGLGGTTNYVTNGCCACGMPGRPGLIRISYK